MATIWKKTVGDNHYEVRKSGASLRLYTNGVFHSQYNNDYPLSGSVWDMLLLPALMKPLGTVKTVLVLGVGAGAVIRQLQKLVKPVLIIGVDLDPVHLEVAKRIYQVNRYGDVELLCANAVDWMKFYDGPKFDLIVEDLFIEQNGEPVRAVKAGAHWCSRLRENLSENGALVMNFDSISSFSGSTMRQESLLKDSFKATFSLTVPGYENRVGGFFTGAGELAILNENLKQLKVEHGAKLTQRLNARITKLN